MAANDPIAEVGSKSETFLMRTLATGPFPWLIGGCALFVAVAYLWLAGSAIVVDDTRGVKSAVVTNNGGSEQKLYKLWDGYFYAIPEIEGVIEVRCAEGAKKQSGYVTGLMHTKVKVVGDRQCERVVEAS